MSYKCAGNLISKYLVLTDVFCVRHNNVLISEKQLFVTLGTNELYNFENVLETKEIIPHWSATIDLAMIVLKQAAQLGPRIKPICLWPRAGLSFSLSSRFVEVTGHGLRPDGDLSKQLNHISLYGRSGLHCLKRNPSYVNFLKDGKFCAENNGGNRTGICFGDTGGGLYKRSDQAYYLRGILTNIPDTLTIDKPCTLIPSVVFLDITNHLDWIQKQIT